MQRSVLLARVGTRICGLDLASVSEMMRPLPVEPMAGAPGFVRGLAIVRGGPTPVVDLGVLLMAPNDYDVRHWVTVRVAGRLVALAVGAVLGVERLDASQLAAAPSLLGEAAREHVEALGALDRELLVILNTAKLVPDEVFHRAGVAPGPLA